jgi:type IV pilus modification protein PilV
VRSARSSDSGFTLIEVMMAMTILGVGLLTIAVAQITAIKTSSKSKNLQQAMFLAREAMDDLEARPNNDAIFQSNSVTDDPNNPIQVGQKQGDETRFTRSVEITPNDPAPNVARVVVTVTWENPAAGGIREVKLDSVKRMK